MLHENDVDTAANGSQQAEHISEVNNHTAHFRCIAEQEHSDQADACTCKQETAYLYSVDHQVDHGNNQETESGEEGSSYRSRILNTYYIENVHS